MQPFFSTLLFLGGVLSLFPIVQGEGEVVRKIPEDLRMKTEQKNVAEDVHEIFVNGSAIVYVTQGDTNSLTLEGNDSVIAKTSVTQTDGKFILITEKRVLENVRFLMPKLTCKMTLKNVSKAVSREGAQIKLGTLRSDALDLEVHDNGRIDVVLNGNSVSSFIERSGQIFIAGTVDKQVAVLAGDGLYEANGLTSRECKVDVFRDGTAFVIASDLLTVNINENGKVNYSGNPAQIISNVSQTGKLIPH
jgi:hypothetical protein